MRIYKIIKFIDIHVNFYYNKTVKQKLLTIVITLILLISIPVSMICVGFCLPAQYGNTYYAALPKMFQKLKNTEGKKIIVVGNSAVAEIEIPEKPQVPDDGKDSAYFTYEN